MQIDIPDSGKQSNDGREDGTINNAENKCESLEDKLWTYVLSIDPFCQLAYLLTMRISATS